MRYLEAVRLRCAFVLHEPQDIRDRLSLRQAAWIRNPAHKARRAFHPVINAPRLRICDR